MLKYLSVQQVAEALSFHPMTVYKLVYSGKLRAVKVSRKAVRISQDELNRFLEERTICPAA